MLFNGDDLKKEQASSLERPRQKYTWAARFFFKSMDLATGPKITLGKVLLIEMLASIPYRAWEIREYIKLTRRYQDADEVRRNRMIMEWGRISQDNEYYHLLVIYEKMKADKVANPWFLTWPIPQLMVWGYAIFARLMAKFCLKRAFHFNAEFEDHAEHVYAAYVAEHPEWEEQLVGDNKIVHEYAASTNTVVETWADVFRRIGLDERDHMNKSFVLCGQGEKVVEYDKMPNYQQD